MKGGQCLYIDQCYDSIILAFMVKIMAIVK